MQYLSKSRITPHHAEDKQSYSFFFVLVKQRNTKTVQAHLDFTLFTYFFFCHMYRNSPSLEPTPSVPDSPKL